MTSEATPGDKPPPPPADSIDLTSEPNIFSETLAPGIPTVDTSVVQTTTSTDIARISLSFLLVGILAVVVVISVVTVATNGKSEPTIEALLKVILSPIIGLVGSVVGFYFGAKASGGSTPS
jgi:hypothetical protein